MPEVRVLRRITDELARATGEGSLGDGEATALWAAVSGMKSAEVWLKRDSEALPDVVDRFWKAVEQRKRGVPFAYVAGSVGFRTLDLNIDPRALIPRPETEGLVDLVLARCSTGLVADVGTGCGCIALALAVEGQFDKVVAVERSAAAAALARENVKRVAARTPVEIREGKLLAPLVDQGERYQAIVSNPPYVRSADIGSLATEVRNHDPLAALDGGADGLDAYRVLIPQAACLLAPRAALVVEAGEGQSGQIQDLMTAEGLTPAGGPKADLAGIPRAVAGRKMPR